MRLPLIALPLALFAAPALAQTPAPPPQATPEPIQIPPELSDPGLPAKLSRVMEALSEAFLDLPVGKVEAAIEGRQPTAADRRRTVRRETGMTERQLKQQIAQSRPMMEAATRALVAALPAMMKGMSEAGKELEKATANLPQPNYPKQ